MTRACHLPDAHRLRDLLHDGAVIFPRCSCGWRSVGGFDNAGLAAGAWSDHRIEARRVAAADRAAYMRRYRAGAS